jgi:hypothetical protein
MAWRRRRQAMAKWRRSGSLGFPQRSGSLKGPRVQRHWLGLKRHLAMAWPHRRHRAALACGMAWQHIFGNSD